MMPSGMLLRVAVVKTDVSEERSPSIIRVTRICEQGITLASTSNQRNLVTAYVPTSTILAILMMQALGSSETSVMTITTRHNITEDGIFQ
jgi:hypothetical protein